MEEGKDSLQAPDIRPGPQTSGPWRSTRLGICRRRYRNRTFDVPLVHSVPTGNPAKNPEHPAPVSREHRGLPRQPRHPVIAPDILRLPKPRTSSPSERTSGITHLVNKRANSTGLDIRPLQPGHPAPRERPDIRPVARTSGALCLRATPLGRDPCNPFTPLTIYTPSSCTI